MHVYMSCCREGIEDVVLSKRRFQYEQEIEKDPLNYDAWFDYIKLEESTGNQERIREVRLKSSWGRAWNRMYKIEEGCK